MKESFKILFHDRMIIITLAASSILLLGELALLIITFAKTPPLLPLLYQQPWGLKQIVQKQFIFLLPIISLFFTAINILLAAMFYKRTPLLSRMFLWGSLFIFTLSTISVFRIIFLVS